MTARLQPPIAVLFAVMLAAVAACGTARAQDTAAVPRLGACGPVAGAFQLPGSDACLRLSSFVAADVGTWRTPALAATSLMPAGSPSGDLGRPAIGTDARVSADVRIPTDLGPARVYLSLRARHGALTAGR